MLNQSSKLQFSTNQQKEQSERLKDIIKQELLAEFEEKIKIQKHDGVHSIKVDYNDLENLPTIGGGYEDRGDPSSYDLTSPTIDSAWHDWDLSSIIPEDTKLVRFRVQFRSSSSVGEYISLRKKGDTGGIDEGLAMSFTTLNYHNMITECQCDTSRIVQYNINSNLTNVSLAVIGWWL